MRLLPSLISRRSEQSVKLLGLLAAPSFFLPLFPEVTLEEGKFSEDEKADPTAIRSTLWAEPGLVELAYLYGQGMLVGAVEIRRFEEREK